MIARAALVRAFAGAALLAPTMGFAQGPDASRAPAEPHLAVDDWSRLALRRMAGLGLIDAGAALQAWPMRRSRVRDLFTAASERAGSAAVTVLPRPHADPQSTPATTTSSTARLTEAMHASFLREHPPAPVAAIVANARVRSGRIDQAGRLLGGVSTRSAGGAWEYGGPVPAPQSDGAFIGLDADVAWRIGLGAALRSSSRGSVDDAHLALAAGPLDILAGRMPLTLGVGRSGGIVLSPERAFDGVALRTSWPLRMPGPLRFLRDLRGTLLISRLERSGPVDAPWFGAAALGLAPTRNLHIGLQRAAMFGGAGNVQSLSARNLLFLLAGMTSQGGKDSGFENQVASVDVWARFTSFGIPFAVYGELGVDDVGFTLFSTAAFIAGLELPALPGVPALSVGVEHARFPHSCCTHPPWYRHGDLAEGWTDRGWLLGHPLGGEGSEWALHWSAALPRVWLSGRAFTRHRGEENLFAPVRTGRAWGGALRVDAPFAQRLGVNAAFAWERGHGGWDHWSVELAARLRLSAGAARIPGADDRAAAKERSPKQ